MWMEAEVAADSREHQQSNMARNQFTVIVSDTDQQQREAEMDPIQKLKKSLEKLRKRHLFLTWYTLYCTDGQ